MDMFNKIVDKIKLFFTFLFCTFQNNYSKKWDKEINELLKTCEPKLGKKNCLDGDYYNLHLGPRTLWIQNYPYSFATPYTDVEKATFGRVRPSKKNILKIKKIVDELVKKERYKKKININEFKLLR
jgi:hypothetical protein